MLDVEKSKSLSIVAIVVTYNPESGNLQRLMNALAPQVKFIVIVDNGSSIAPSVFVNQSNPCVVEVLGLNENHGIAAAQNAGIEWSRKRGAEFVLLMDQDSIPRHDMVEELLCAISTKTSLPAAVGPCYVDERQNNFTPFAQTVGLRLVRESCTSSGGAVVPVDYLISSGCLIPLKVLDKVGCMRDDLFIDYVDVEWGLRARYLGFQSYGVCSAYMQHSLGEPPIKLFGRFFLSHSPLRHYYQFRNAILVFKASWVPWNWKFVHSWRLCRSGVINIFFAKPRIAHLRMMILGVWHGLINRTGKL